MRSLYILSVVIYIIFVSVSCTKDNDVSKEDDEILCIPSLSFYPFCETPIDVFIPSSNFPEDLRSEANIYFTNLNNVLGVASKFCNSIDTLILAFEQSPDGSDIDTIQIFDSCNAHYAVMSRVDNDFEFEEPIEALIGSDLDGYVDVVWNITDKENKEIYYSQLVDNTNRICGENVCAFLFDFESSTFCNLCM
jgi:hypothetical protein